MLSLVAAVVLMSASADEIRRYSTYLEDGMTREQVVAKLGNPDEAALEVCGSSTAAPWRCYRWTYWEDGRHGALTVLFALAPVAPAPQYRDLGFIPDPQWQVKVWTVL